VSGSGMKFRGFLTPPPSPTKKKNSSPLFPQNKKKKKEKKDTVSVRIFLSSTKVAVSQLRILLSQIFEELYENMTILPLTSHYQLHYVISH